jgi:hypothetical protein
MARKQIHSTEEARRRLQGSRDTRANAVQTSQDSTEQGVARDKAFAAFGAPKGGRKVRTMAAPVRQYWPSANSQRAPSRPQGTKKSPR